MFQLGYAGFRLWEAKQPPSLLQRPENPTLHPAFHACTSKFWKGSSNDSSCHAFIQIIFSINLHTLLACDDY